MNTPHQPSVVTSQLWRECLEADAKWKKHLLALYWNHLPRSVVLLGRCIIEIISAYELMLRRAPYRLICKLHPFISRMQLTDAIRGDIETLFTNVIGLRVRENRLEMCCSRGTERPLVLAVLQCSDRYTVHLRTALSSEMEPFVSTAHTRVVNDDIRAPDAVAAPTCSRLDQLRLCMNESAALCGITPTDSQRLWLDAAAWAYAHGAGELITSTCRRRVGTSTLYSIAIFAIHLLETRVGGTPSNLAPTVFMGLNLKLARESRYMFSRVASAYKGVVVDVDPKGNVVLDWHADAGQTRVAFRSATFGQRDPPKLAVLDYHESHVSDGCAPVSATATNGFTMRNGPIKAPRLDIAEHTPSQFIYAAMRAATNEAQTRPQWETVGHDIPSDDSSILDHIAQVLYADAHAPTNETQTRPQWETAGHDIPTEVPFILDHVATAVSTPARLTPPPVVVSELWTRCLAADVEWQKHLTALYQNHLPHLVVLLGRDLIAIIAAYEPTLRHAPHSVIYDLHPCANFAGLANHTWMSISRLFSNVVGLRVRENRLEVCCSRGTERPLVLTVSQCSDGYTVHLRTALPSEMEPFVSATYERMANDDMRAPDGTTVAVSSMSRLDKLRRCMTESAELHAFKPTDSHRLWLDAAACAYVHGAGEFTTSGCRSIIGTLYNIAILAIHLLETRDGGQTANLRPTAFVSSHSHNANEPRDAFLNAVSAYPAASGRVDPNGTVVVDWRHRFNATPGAPPQTCVEFRSERYGRGTEPPKLWVQDYQQGHYFSDYPLNNPSTNGEFILSNAWGVNLALYIAERTPSQFIFVAVPTPSLEAQPEEEKDRVEATKAIVDDHMRVVAELKRAYTTLRDIALDSSPPASPYI